MENVQTSALGASTAKDSAVFMSAHGLKGSTTYTISHSDIFIRPYLRHNEYICLFQGDDKSCLLTVV